MNLSDKVASIYESVYEDRNSYRIEVGSVSMRLALAGLCMPIPLELRVGMYHVGYLLRDQATHIQVGASLQIVF